MSASTVARLKEKWNAELAKWRARPLDDLEVVYVWVDGVYVKAGLEKEKAAILVVMAAPGYRESTQSLVRCAQGHQASRVELPSAGGWRRTPGHLGSTAQRLSAGGGATAAGTTR